MANPTETTNQNTPLQNLEEWEDFLKERYPRPAANAGFQATNPDKKPEQFRNYEATARPTVREFYRPFGVHLDGDNAVGAFGEGEFGEDNGIFG